MSTHVGYLCGITPDDFTIAEFESGTHLVCPLCGPTWRDGGLGGEAPGDIRALADRHVADKHDPLQFPRVVVEGGVGEVTQSTLVLAGLLARPTCGGTHGWLAQRGHAGSFGESADMVPIVVRAFSDLPRRRVALGQVPNDRGTQRLALFLGDGLRGIEFGGELTDLFEGRGLDGGVVFRRGHDRIIPLRDASGECNGVSHVLSPWRTAPRGRMLHHVATLHHTKGRRHRAAYRPEPHVGSGMRERNTRPAIAPERSPPAQTHSKEQHSTWQ